MVKVGVVNARFQVLHLKHMEYLLAAKMRCKKLYIGITNPDPSYIRVSVNDENRSTKAGNPLTYFERYEMIRGAMKAFGVPESEYDIIPFPINRPEYITHYVPKDATHFIGICDAWDEEKYKIMVGLGLDVEVLWRRNREESGVTGTWVRSCIALDQEWAHLVPKPVYEYLTKNELDKRIKRLEMMRIEEKNPDYVKIED
jgi:nicotinamide-nucleotide adenylyltransferase